MSFCFTPGVDLEPCSPFGLELPDLSQPLPPFSTFSDLDPNDEYFEDQERFYDDLEDMQRAWGTEVKGNLALKSFLRNAGRKIRQEKAELERLGVDSHVIRARMQELRGQFATTAKIIAANASAFDAERTQTEGAYQAVSARIEGARPDFTAFTKKPVKKVEKAERVEAAESGAHASACTTPSPAQASYHMILQDKAMETMVRARVAAATLNAVGSVVKETVAVVAGCRGEGEENCKALFGYVNKGVEKVEEVAMHVATQMGAQPVIKRMMNADGTALTQRLGELGIDREPNGQLFQVNAKQYVQDCKTVSLAAAGTGGVIGATKLFRTGASSGGPTGAIRNFLKDECGGVKLPISREFTALKETETYFKHRIIREQTKLLPEDLGLNPALFHESNRALFGEIQMSGDTLKVFINLIKMEDRTLGPALNVMANLKKMAYANSAKVLEIETAIAHPRLRALMMKRYGAYVVNIPEYKGLDMHKIFRIPISDP